MTSNLAMVVLLFFVLDRQGDTQKSILADLRGDLRGDLLSRLTKWTLMRLGSCGCRSVRGVFYTTATTQPHTHCSTYICWVAPRALVVVGCATSLWRSAVISEKEHVFLTHTHTHT